MSRILLDELKLTAQNEPCLTCECLQGALATLTVEASDAAIRAEAKAMRVERSRLHGCLGCEPCPPADNLVAFRARISLAPTDSCGCSCECQ